MRVQRAALAIIKTTISDEPHLLLQFDPKAEQYQLIGGRLKINETPERALIREIAEELPEASLVFGIDYQIRLLTEKPITVMAISPTSKSKTQYFFWIFWMFIIKEDFNPSYEMNKWISLSSLLERKDKFYLLLNMELPMKLDELQNSISSDLVKY